MNKGTKVSFLWPPGSGNRCVGEVTADEVNGGLVLVSIEDKSTGLNIVVRCRVEDLQEVK